jgi:hypothetical protein
MDPHSWLTLIPLTCSSVVKMFSKHGAEKILIQFDVQVRLPNEPEGLLLHRSH